MNVVSYLHHPSPIGPLRLAASERGLRALHMSAQRHVPEQPDPRWLQATPDHPAQGRILAQAARQLDEYFAGGRRAFDLPLDLAGTAFQQAVWTALCTIGFGQTASYGELARRIGNPNAVRAVGLANGRNPVSIIVPCHRVIGADGSMTGYGGGLERKVFLLALEKATTPERSAPLPAPAGMPGRPPRGEPGSRF